jgi:hypothetical protein
VSFFGHNKPGDTPTPPLKTITLPDRDNMLRRLRTVSSDRYMEERFFPHILKSAGHELAGEGVVNMLQLAIMDFAQDMPPTVGSTLQLSVDAYITALVDDKEAREAALAMMKAVRERSR